MNHYGVGYDAGRNTLQSDSTTAYDRTWFWFNPRFLVQMHGALYGGLTWDVNYTQRLDVGFAEEEEGWQPALYFNFNEAF